MRGKAWTKEEVKFLRENYVSLTNRELCERLNRSYKSIRFMAYKLGLKKDWETFCRARKNSNVVVRKDVLEKLYLLDKKSTREIAEEIGLGKNTIDYYLKKFGITKRSYSDANKLSFLKYGNWKKGLTKDNDKRVFLATEKMKETKKIMKLKILMQGSILLEELGSGIGIIE